MPQAHVCCVRSVSTGRKRKRTRELAAHEAHSEHLHRRLIVANALACPFPLLIIVRTVTGYLACSSSRSSSEALLTCATHFVPFRAIFVRMLAVSTGVIFGAALARLCGGAARIAQQS